MHRQLCKWICPSTLSKDLCNFSKDGKGLLKWRKLFVSQRKELKIRIIVDFTMMSSFHGETPKGRYKKHPSQHKTSIVKCQISRLFGYIEIGSDGFESGRRIRITVHVMSQPPVCHVWCGFVSMLSNGELFCGLSNHVVKVIHLLAEFSRWLTAKRTPDGFDWKRTPDEQYNSRKKNMFFFCDGVSERIQNESRDRSCTMSRRLPHWEQATSLAGAWLGCWWCRVLPKQHELLAVRVRKAVWWRNFGIMSPVVGPTKWLGTKKRKTS